MSLSKAEKRIILHQNANFSLTFFWKITFQRLRSSVMLPPMWLVDSTHLETVSTDTQLLNITIICIIQFSAKDLLHGTVDGIIKRRKENPPPPERQLFIDILLENNLPESQIKSDATSYVIGGFHTSGNCKPFEILHC